jgi:hypothetical protein
MSRWNEPEEPVDTEIKEGKKYKNSELNAIADELLRQDSKVELCRECGERGVKEDAEVVPQDAYDDEGNKLAIEFPKYTCENGHEWYEGEGKPRGIAGEDPILFEEHIQSRRRREIFTSLGTPDPSIVQGIYNRTHPQGRKVNSKEQRKKNGASYFR